MSQYNKLVGSASGAFLGSNMYGTVPVRKEEISSFMGECPTVQTSILRHRWKKIIVAAAEWSVNSNKETNHIQRPACDR